MALLFTGEIDGYNHEGMGILRRGRQIVFVPAALDGEIVRTRFSGRKKGDTLWGCAPEILTVSPHRQPPLCPHDSRCGGCQLQHAVYSHQLEIKQSILTRALAPLRKQDSRILSKIQPVVPAPKPFGYRNKGVFAVGALENGLPAIGFYGRQSRSIAGHGCPGLFSGRVNLLLDDLVRWLAEHQAFGTVHHILIRESGTNGEIILVFIGERKPNWIRDFPNPFPAPGLKREYQLAGVGWLTSKNKNGPVIGQKPITISGSLEIEEHCAPGYPAAPGPDSPDAFRFMVSPDAFFQVNTHQVNTLYQEVLSACRLAGDEILWDLYCGAGTMSVCLAKHAKAVLGVDVNRSAIRDAWINARINSADIRQPLTERLCFLADTAEKLALSWSRQPGFLTEAVARQTKLYTETGGKTNRPPKELVRLLSEKNPDVIVLDPSEKGAAPGVIQMILTVKPRTVVYVSCDTATLGRDLGMLTGTGLYVIANVRPVDMFPQTAHIESVVTLQRND